MPIASATEFISLDALATHLSVDYDSANTEQTAELTGIVSAAVGWVEQWVGQPILDRTFRVLVHRPNDRDTTVGAPYFDYGFPYYEVRLSTEDAPVIVPVRGIRGSMSIAYWEEGQTLSEEPTGSVSPGRVDPVRTEAVQGLPEANRLLDQPRLFPPADGWPEGADGTPFVITGSTGFEAVADVPPQWRIAALHCASFMFESPKTADSYLMTAKRLLAQWTFKGNYQGLNPEVY